MTDNKNSKIPDSFNDRVSYPFLWYKSNDDSLIYLEKEESHYFEKMNDYLSLIMALDDNKVIGFQLKQAKTILEAINNGTIVDGMGLGKKQKYSPRSSSDEENVFDQMKEFNKD